MRSPEPAQRPTVVRSLSTLLFGPPDETDLRGRVYLITCLATALVFGITCFENAQLGLGKEIALLTGGSSAVLLVLFFVARRDPARGQQTALALVIIYLNAFGGFFGNGGSSGGVQHFWPAAVSISVFLLHTGRARIAVLLAYALGALGVLLLEFHAPELVHPYDSRTARFLDLAFTHPLAMAASAASLLAVSLAYDQGTQAVRDAHARSDQLLLALLPPRAAQHLQLQLKSQQPQPEGQLPSQGKIYAEDIEEATLLFADMVGFSRRVQAAPSEQVVRELDRLFRALDSIAVAHGVAKIKTVGDSYMAAAGLDPDWRGPDRLDQRDRSPVPAQAVASAALAFLDAAEALSFLGEPLKLRIGMATGPVTAGVIGSQRPHYDVWGDTVNLAARLESHGTASRIRVCPLTAQRLEGTHRCLPAPELRLSERPVTRTFWLEGRRETDPGPGSKD